MSHNILITGVSGYLGGSLLARWKEANLTAHCNKLFALVRTPAQAEAVRTQYGAEPLIFDAFNEAEVRKAVLENSLNVVFHLIAPATHTSQAYFIKAMAELKEKTGREVHFLHVRFWALSYESHSVFSPCALLFNSLGTLLMNRNTSID
jgi:dTDP-4-dehydrorhamnose reductase